MQRLLGRMFLPLVFCCLMAPLPAISQNQTPPPNGRPGGQQGRPQPGGPKPGGQNPGNRPAPGNRPQPSRPVGSRPGGGPGNNRPNPGGPPPSRPNPNPGGRPGVKPPPPRPGPGPRPPVQKPPVHGPARPPSNRPPQWGKPPQHRPSYSFRPDNRNYLRRYYQHRLGYINRARRPVFTVGGFFPFGDIGYITPLPPQVYGQLPPPPPGYNMGYFDGYVVVYDPATYFIANVIDLLQ
jgi:hypothetical protein